MELTSTQELNVKLAAIIIDCKPTIESMKLSLLKLFPDLDSGRKKTDDLIQEILDGEVDLHKIMGGGLIRMAHTVRLSIKSPVDEKSLQELYEEYPDGTKIEHNYDGIRALTKGFEAPSDTGILLAKELGLTIQYSDMFALAEDFQDDLVSDYQGIRSKIHLYSYSVLISQNDYRPEYKVIKPEKTVVFSWR